MHWPLEALKLFSCFKSKYILFFIRLHGLREKRGTMIESVFLQLCLSLLFCRFQFLSKESFRWCLRILKSSFLLKLWCHDGGDSSGKPLLICQVPLPKLQLPILADAKVTAVGKSEAVPVFRAEHLKPLRCAVFPTKWTDFLFYLGGISQSQIRAMCVPDGSDPAGSSQSFIPDLG